jgi:oligosaccharyltransferase complex subunit gamma
LFLSLVCKLHQSFFFSNQQLDHMQERMLDRKDLTSRAGKHTLSRRRRRVADTGYRSQSAEQTHAWIARQLPGRPHPSIKRPINWIRIIAVGTTLLGTVAFVSVAWPYIVPVLQSRNVWAAISLIAILLFTSGHMFNHIRKVPYVAANQKGGVSYFAGGFSNQYGLETQIIAAICK